MERPAPAKGSSYRQILLWLVDEVPGVGRAAQALRASDYDHGVYELLQDRVLAVAAAIRLLDDTDSPKPDDDMPPIWTIGAIHVLWLALEHSATGGENPIPGATPEEPGWWWLADHAEYIADEIGCWAMAKHSELKRKAEVGAA